VREALVVTTEIVVSLIDWIVLLVVVAATARCAVEVVRATLNNYTGPALRTVWLDYARWLVAALTFQLASDILESAIAPTWEDIGRLAAIAVIRTFLEYFLDRDVSEVRERQVEAAPERERGVGPAG
jgi:uncharacterized membrane protein